MTGGWRHAVVPAISIALACSRAAPAPVDCESHPFLQRWVWDTVVVGSAGPGSKPDTLTSHERFCVGGVEGDRRPILLSGDTVGYIADSVAQRERLPSLADAAAYAQAVITRELAFPSSVRFPIHDPSAAHCGGGRFVVRSTFQAEDAEGREQEAAWRVELRRTRHRWVVDNAIVTPTSAGAEPDPTEPLCPETTGGG